MRTGTAQRSFGAKPAQFSGNMRFARKNRVCCASRVSAIRQTMFRQRLANEVAQIPQTKLENPRAPTPFCLAACNSRAQFLSSDESQESHLRHWSLVIRHSFPV